MQATSEQEAKTSCKEFSLISRSADSPGATQQEDKEEGLITVPLVVKGDVMGSVEALLDIIKAHHPEGMKLNVVQSGVGALSDGDLEMAKSTKGGLLAIKYNDHYLYCITEPTFKRVSKQLTAMSFKY